MVEWAYIAILVGIAGGFLWVVLLSIFRSRKKVNSLLKSEDLVGKECTVEIPFDENSRGKVRVSVKGSTMDLVAVTEEKFKLERGETAIILERKNNTVLVLSERNLVGKKIDGYFQ